MCRYLLSQHSVPVARRCSRLSHSGSVWPDLLLCGGERLHVEIREFLLVSVWSDEARLRQLISRLTCVCFGFYPHRAPSTRQGRTTCWGCVTVWVEYKIKPRTVTDVFHIAHTNFACVCACAYTDLLRRLSKSQNTVFCGRIQLFLARLFPLSEKSGNHLNPSQSPGSIMLWKLF